MSRDRDRALSQRLHPRVYAKLDALNRQLYRGVNQFSAEEQQVLHKHSKIWMQQYGLTLVALSSIMTIGFISGSFLSGRESSWAFAAYFVAIASLCGMLWMYKKNLRQVNTGELANLAQVARFDDLEAAYVDAMVVLHESQLAEEQIEGVSKNLNSLLDRVDQLDKRLESIKTRVEDHQEAERTQTELARLKERANAGDQQAAAGVPLLELRASRQISLQQAVDQIESEKIIIRNTFRNVAESVDHLRALSQTEVPDAIQTIHSQIDALNLQSQEIEAAVDEVISAT